MRTTERFIWICVVAIIFVFWWLFTTINAPWWILSLTITLGVLAWLQTHESTRMERYNAFLIILIVMSTLYYRSFQIKKSLQENYANGPNMSEPSAPNMKTNELEAQIADLEEKLKNATHHKEVKPNKVASQVLSQFLSTTSESSRPRPSMGNIDESDVMMTLKKDEKTLPTDDTSFDKYTPAQAQRATYQLVNTVQQLKETMENLGPVLKEGKNVMSMFEKMDLGETMDKLEKMGGAEMTKDMGEFMKMMNSVQSKE